MVQDYNIYSGNFGTIRTNGGDVNIYGGYIDEIHCEGGTVKHFGGTIVNGFSGNSSSYQPRVIYRDSIVYKERTTGRACDIDEITRLRSSNYDLRLKVKKLEEELSKSSKKDGTDSNVESLWFKIDGLQAKIEAQRSEHHKKVAELEENIEGLKEAYHNILDELKKTQQELRDVKKEQSRTIAEEHVDILATMMSLYPFTADADISFEFGIPKHRVADVAKSLGLIKSKEARQEAVEYLRAQDRELVQRRGGDKGVHTTAKVVEMVAKNGRVVATYDSIKDANKNTGCSQKTIRDLCKRYNKARKYTKDGFTFRLAQK